MMRRPLAPIALLLLSACSLTPAPPTVPLRGPDTPLSIGAQAQQTSFELRNVGSQTLSWQLDIEDDPDASNPPGGPWFTASPQAGQLEAGARETLTLTLLSGLLEGRYRAILTIVYPGGTTPFEVLGEVGTGSPGDVDFAIDLSPTSLSLLPGAVGEVSVTVSSQQAGGVSLDVTAPSGLTAALSAAGPGQALLTVTAAPGLSAGTRSLVVEGSRAGATVSATLTVTIGGEPQTATLDGRVETANAAIPSRPATTTAGAAMLATPAPATLVANQLLVGYEPPQLPPGTDAALATQTRQQQAEAVRQQYGLTALSPRNGDLPELVAVAPGRDLLAVARALEQDPRVRYAEPNYRLALQGLPNDPRLEEQWHLPLTGVPLSWQAQDGSSVVIAVIDTGIDLDHEDLAGVFASGGYDFCASTDCGSRDGDPRPVGNDAHGTHVTGLIAARSGNAPGGSGTLGGGARIVPVKVFPGGMGSFTTVAALADAIRWAAGENLPAVPTNQHPAQIINLSLGGSQDSQALHDAVIAARNRGVLVVAAAGNSGLGQTSFPARYPETLAVGAVNSGLGRSCFSNHGLGLDLMAPGGDGFICQATSDEALLSTIPGNGYGLDAGTSMAAPQVTAAAALLWDLLANPSAEQVTATLLSSAYFDPAVMTTGSHGAGVLRVDAALGFPGPGSAVSVMAQGNIDSAVAQVRLDPYGASTLFSLGGLAAGSYLVEAIAAGPTRTLIARADLVLEAGELRETTLFLAP